MGQRVHPPPKTCCDYICNNIECLRSLARRPRATWTVCTNRRMQRLLDLIRRHVRGNNHVKRASRMPSCRCETPPPILQLVACLPPSCPCTQPQIVRFVRACWQTPVDPSICRLRMRRRKVVRRSRSFIGGISASATR